MYIPLMRLARSPNTNKIFENFAFRPVYCDGLEGKPRSRQIAEGISEGNRAALLFSVIRVDNLI